MPFFAGFVVGFVAWFLYNYLWSGIYTVEQNELAVKTVFGRAQRIEGKTILSLPVAINLIDEERERYAYPQVVVIPPGGPYFKFPWEEVHKVNISTQTLNMALDPEDPAANHAGQYLEAVTKDQLNTRSAVRSAIASPTRTYAYLFGLKPIFTSWPILFRFCASTSPTSKHRRPKKQRHRRRFDQRSAQKPALNQRTHDAECTSLPRAMASRSLADYQHRPARRSRKRPAAINTAHNEVSSEISLARLLPTRRSCSRAAPRN